MFYHSTTLDAKCQYPKKEEGLSAFIKSFFLESDSILEICGTAGKDSVIR